LENLCKTCLHRNRRVFTFNHPEEYEEGGDLVVITITCLLLNIDIGDEETIECNKYERISPGG
jgi:hypothetical protein